MFSYKNEIREYIDSHKSEIVEILKELIRIPSVRGEADEGAPFGKDCARALEYTNALYKENGFECELDAEGGYLLSCFGEGEKSLGIFAHSDVVPAGEGWTLTQPFEPKEVDGFIVGRGATDDKSATVLSLYCAKIIKELKLPFSSRLICFTGSNEESGMEDIRAYVKKHTAPDFSLVCDTAFPIYRGNKGILRFVATQTQPMKEVTDFYGGSAFNVVLGEAKATVHKKIFTEKGISRHAALPESSLNAAYLLSKKLSEQDEICEEDRDAMLFISSVTEKYYGEIYGIENTDKDFGRLTVTSGIVNMKDGRVSLSFDMRYDVSVNIEEAKSNITAFFNDNGWSVEYVHEAAPFIIDEHNPYIKSCLKVYREFSGDREAVTYVNAGGTYARYLPCAAEIGTSFGGGRPDALPSGHGSVHQPDECISIDGFLNAIELTTLMLLECDKEMNK